MTDQRRYSEDEVAAIFERATRVDSAPQRESAGELEPAERTGMSLDEIQRIGAEVGIEPDAIAAAARALTHIPAEVPEVNRTWLGLPLGVAGSAELPRRLTDDEWAQLVALVRDRFSAHGKLDEAGALRSWRNGNLRVQLEPTADGQRIRMQTYRQSSAQLMRVGAGMLGLSVIMGGLLTLMGDPEAAIGSFGTLGLIGSGFLTVNALTLRGWAAERRRQMAEIAERAVELASRALPGADRGSTDTSRLGPGDDEE